VISLGSLAVKGVLFDLDGTLFDRDTAVRDLFAAQFREFQGQLGGITSEHYVERLIELDGHGHADKRVVFGTLVRELGLDSELGDVLEDHYREIYPAFGAPFPDALPTLRELRARGIAIGLVTNGRADVQAAKVQRLGLEPLLDATLISEREGLNKPDRRIFERALARLGVAPEHAWHVGDHPTADVAGAHAAGLTAVWRYVPYWPEPACRAFTIHQLGELLPLLDARAARR
jgi:putative hydrolase of the HAD superfamily